MREFGLAKVRSGSFAAGSAETACPQMSALHLPTVNRGAEPSRDVLSAGHCAHLRRSAGPDAPWPRFMAAAARCRLSGAAGSGLMPLASLHQQCQGGRPGYRSRLVVLDFRNGVIRVAPTGSKASPSVRYAFNGDRICASQRTDAMCQKATWHVSRQRLLLGGQGLHDFARAVDE